MQLHDFAAQLEEYTKLITKHNADDEHYRAQVNQRLAQFQARLETAGSTDEVDQAFLDLKAAVNAQPLLALPDGATLPDGQPVPPAPSTPPAPEQPEPLLGDIPVGSIGSPETRTAGMIWDGTEWKQPEPSPTAPTSPVDQPTGVETSATNTDANMNTTPVLTPGETAPPPAAPSVEPAPADTSVGFPLGTTPPDAVQPGEIAQFDRETE